MGQCKPGSTSYRIQYRLYVAESKADAHVGLLLLESGIKPFLKKIIEDADKRTVSENLDINILV